MVTVTEVSPLIKQRVIINGCVGTLDWIAPSKKQGHNGFEGYVLLEQGGADWFPIEQISAVSAEKEQVG